MKQLKKPFVVILSVLFLLSGFTSSALAVENKSHTLDLVIKISDLEEKLQLINSLAEEGQTPSGSPVAFVSQMLQGTDWIDPGRLIVIGGVMKQDQYEFAALIPFKTPNPDFQTAMNASAGPDYYVLGFPSGGPKEKVPQVMETALVEASKTPAEAFFSIEVSVNQMIRKGDQKIKAFIQTLEQAAGDEAGGDMEFSEEELKTAIENLIKMGAQVDMLAERFDFNKERFSFSGEMMAVKDSDLFWIFSRNNNVQFLGNYIPNRQMNFRIGQHNVQGFSRMVSDAFGMMYKKMGIDLESLSELMGYFNGEMVGGIDLSNSGLQLEMITVFEEKKVEDDFITKVYFPWLKNYMESMNAFSIGMDASAPESVFLQMPETEVEGRKVYGGMLQIPMISEIVHGPSAAPNPAMGQMFFRMVQVDKYLLTAPDDKRLGELIKLAETFSEAPDPGPFMTYEIDMDAYLSVITDGFKNRPDRKNLPKVGKLKFVTEAENGKLTTTTSMAFDKIKNMIALFPAEGPGPRTRMEAKPAAEDRDQRGERQVMDEKPSPVKIDEEDPRYWADKAGLSATYGNNAAAVKYYTRAISLDPGNSDYYYFMGVCYGEMGQLDKALENINQAISMNSSNARYLYGRGRVYLMDGNEEAAMRDFNAAASAGDRDARNYLMYKSQKR